ncbi:ATP-dependent 6-phosphofructokinase 5, chloroplastic-like isoform X1 [Hordeum vulgare subsp. vulgare]|uniref:ATP-dependent 6-phosphofructokinase 5, chloroplastic-like isoform X1 n=1 Tax=Hordeum vulgare subsp. vulgare TaxID=112509 RepID=UPI001D1A44D3|nr:ATP-dependent 6-phosphofructokinase 5, chloroplastic-like isoform X1 [Hordeum vulgare subsp. vulgare]XP_044950482.1 ATP-dependent 6-phosphofructokinase 5, chloroplastic-like isoform X1 [Hordeum vulgare subsp. vulgare]
MALASPVDYAGTFTSSQKHHSFVMPGCNGLRCSTIGFGNKSRAAGHLVVRAMSMDRPKLDFSNSNWKDQFQEDFDRRFSLPHLTDIIDVESRPTTFSLKSRAPLENVTGSSEESWNGYVNDDDRALLKVIKFASPTSAGADCIDPDCSWVEQWVHRAGPRKQIYFEPQCVKAGIVTCGGLCPGLNDVIRQIVLTLEKYGVKNIVGIQHGFRGFFEDHLAEVPLNRHVVQNINLAGGSFLGVSRGGASISDIVDSIQARRLDMLFVLGGNGTHAGADAIHDECRKRKLKVSIIGVPKTIDNDILLMDKTFGFDTAVEAAQRAINSAYIEAHSAFHGIGLVKLMGRSSGFITMHASLSSGQVDICLIPEVPFTLDGPNGVLRHLEHLIETKGFALMCVAEGAGQEYLQRSNATDASGNMVLGDIGAHLQQKIKSHFREINVHSDVKYIDPTYMLRAVRANASDAILCTVLGQNAVHGAFAGFSGITTGICNTHNVYLPIPEVIKTPRLVDPNSRMWHRTTSYALHFLAGPELNCYRMNSDSILKIPLVHK